MNPPLNNIPEIVALDSRQNLIRIPGEQDVPVSRRIHKLVETGSFQRLRRISQLGLVSLVYPGATHTRFEHSLGVYRMALLFLKRLASNQKFSELVSTKEAETFLVAALLHDIGHWPYCHPFEDMKLDGVPDHESLARQRLEKTNISDILDREFEIAPEQISNLLEGKYQSESAKVLGSLLSGPIDVDKMDYLYRDSLHAGVPYGMNYDRQRLIGSLCLNRAGDGIAITEKGCTASELMVFARYVMFSEVYWHHTVRSGTAMLQRAFFDLRHKLELKKLFASGDLEFQSEMKRSAENTNSAHLLDGLFGTHRTIFKRLAQFTVLEHPDLFMKLSRKPYPWLTECSNQLADELSRISSVRLGHSDVLIDAPPQGLEVQFEIDVKESNGEYRSLSEKSPVVNVLAKQQFDNYVKRIRIFVRPGRVSAALDDEQISIALERAIEKSGISR